MHTRFGLIAAMVGLGAMIVYSFAFGAGTEPDTPKAPDPAVFEKAIKQLGSPFKDDREKGFATIKGIKPLPAAALAAALESSNVYVRQGAASLLYFAKASQIPPGMAKRMAARITPQEDVNVCIDIARLLYVVQARNAVAPALAYLANRPADAADEELLIALLRLAVLDKAAGRDPVKALVDDPKMPASVRLEGRMTLILLEEPGVEAQLVRTLHQQVNPVRLIALIDRFAQTGRREAFLVATLYAHDGSLAVRIGAYRAVARFGTDEAARLLAGRIATTRPGAERDALLEALVQLGPVGRRQFRDQWYRLAVEPEMVVEVGGKPRLLPPRTSVYVRTAALFPRDTAIPLLLEMMEHHLAHETQTGRLAYSTQMELRALAGDLRLGEPAYELNANGKKKLLAAWKTWWKKTEAKAAKKSEKS